MKNYYRLLIFFPIVFFMTGCASDPQKIDGLEAKIKILENKIYSIQKKDDSEKIEELEKRINALEENYNPLNKKEVPKNPVAIAAQESASNNSYTDQSSSMEEIQKSLKNAGFYAGEIDGKFGQKTKEAIELFQAANGLKVDGKVGPVTWDQLKNFIKEKPEVPTEKEVTAD